MSSKGWSLQVGSSASLEFTLLFDSTERSAVRQFNTAVSGNPGKIVELFRVLPGGELAAKPFRAAGYPDTSRTDDLLRGHGVVR